MPQRLNKLVALSLYYVIEAGGTMPHRDLTNLLTNHIDEEQAYERRLAKLRTQPSETRSETIWKGKEQVARQIIARSLWAGRLIAYGPKGDRAVCLGEPPSTSGRYARPQSWDEFYEYIQPCLDSDLHPTSHDFADPEREGGIESAGYGYGSNEMVNRTDRR
jgi:hypothetical protein